GRGRGVVVHLLGRKGRDLEEGRTRVEQGCDAFARKKLAARGVPVAGLFTTAVGSPGQPGVELVHQGAVEGDVVLELLRARVEAGGKCGHAVAGRVRVRRNSIPGRSAALAAQQKRARRSGPFGYGAVDQLSTFSAALSAASE